MGFFKLKKVTDLNQIDEKTELPESDYSFTRNDNKFYQFEYIEDDNNKTPVVVGPGLFAIDSRMNQLVLAPTTFAEDKLLEEYLHTKEISDKIKMFFAKQDVYKKYGVDPKRGMLLWGKQGTGKSTVIAKVVNQYVKDGNTLAVVWRTDKFEAHTVKDFIAAFQYKDVDKLILIIEDIGGSEYVQRGKRAIESSLLSLLDNVEKIFKVPTMILATTNHPENLLENLTDRPQRFDDVIEVKPPSGEFRAKFLSFFSQGEADAASLDAIQARAYDGMSVAHMKEIVIRGALYDLTLLESMEQLHKQSSKAKKDFFESGKLGL